MLEDGFVVERNGVWCIELALGEELCNVQIPIAVNELPLVSNLKLRA